MTLSERAATAILERIGLQLWGFRPRLMRTIVTLRGPAVSLRWFVCTFGHALELAVLRERVRGARRGARSDQ